MKILPVISAMALGLLVLAGPARAQDITSIQFIQSNSGTPLTPHDIAGAVPASNWNSVQTGGDYNIQGGTGQVTVSASGGLINSNGAASKIEYSLTSYGYLSTGKNSVPGANGNLVNGGAITSGKGSGAPLPVTLKLSGLNAGDTYKIIIYTSGGSNELTYGSVALTGGSTFYFQSAEGDGIGGDLTALQNASSPANVFGSTAVGAAIPNPEALKSNYIEFDGVSGSSTATLTLTELGAWAYGSWAPVPSAGSSSVLGMAGVQIIETGKPGQGQPAGK